MGVEIVINQCTVNQVSRSFNIPNQPAVVIRSDKFMQVQDACKRHHGHFIYGWLSHMAPEAKSRLAPLFCLPSFQITSKECGSPR